MRLELICSGLTKLLVDNNYSPTTINFYKREWKKTKKEEIGVMYVNKLIAIHSVNWACISVLSQVIHSVNERKTVQTNMISFVSHGDKTL